MELSTRERNALVWLYDHGDEPDFTIKGNLSGVGPNTLRSLIDKGLVEEGWSEKWQERGWRLTADGRRCLDELRR